MIQHAHASSENKLQWSANADSAFVSRGFSNWIDATNLEIHYSSKCHKEAALEMVTLPATTMDVAEALSTQHHQKKLEHCQCLLERSF